MKFLITYLITLVVFFVVDIAWLGFFAKDFYKEQIGFLMRETTNWVAALVFYFIFILGLVFFVINPALDSGSIMEALLKGLFFGFIAYATYDLTNLATLENWPIKVTLVDLVWGTTLGGLVSFISYYFSAMV
ncbi:MAG: DUF2177 family protein [Alkalibacterium sp.]|uniref:DUF2177 family protein n=1 Tax=Alkalibacterium TaxID=99906 RepID=UPI002649EE27|nr:DUF2177 family protein [Alkalibacterium sp.]MDN6295352.1 DUF2177 family protein [Alkalibacterium sp.]MDN6326949.1 DUF2177 family protein [Alkalibacterium sp.]MDN6385174.1 DUF2177 family protein [Alkalibacterium sp.]MDN6397691.1 DUF2177 family protein [Alkalibacterium sp.]